jgi:hypothetical protein
VAGYSSKKLKDKLGLKPGMRAAVVRSPAGYIELLEGAEVVNRLNGRFDFIQYFATSTEQLNTVMPNLAGSLVPGGMLWVSWIKKTSPKNTGLDENIVRRLGLEAGLVDVKVAAVTDDWSGLKFVYRLADR